MEATKPESSFERWAWRLSMPCILIIMLVVSSNINGSKDYGKGLIEADGKGYYAYLPAVFIFHDLNFSFFDSIEKKKYYNPNHYYDYRSSANGYTINKYYAGSALALSPFFLGGHFLSLAKNVDIDGYSFYYVHAVRIGALFYFFIAVFFLMKALRTYNIQKINIIYILWAFVFGTHLFFYSIIEFSMSHIYSLAFISIFIYYSRQYFRLLSAKSLLIMSISLGMVCLIRPVNMVIILALPFLASSFKDFRQAFLYLFRKPVLLISAAVVFLLFPLLQLIIYKIQSGDFFIYSYVHEGFNFLKPKIFSILFSYKKGLFVYTPLTLLSLVGFVPIFRRSRYEFYCLLFFLFILTWVLSSWWMWYYGGSFSSRVYVEFLPFFAILLATALQSIRRKSLKRGFLALIIAISLFCQVQTYQYRYYQIHWSEMSKEKYWDVFLRIDRLIK